MIAVLLISSLVAPAPAERIDIEKIQRAWKRQSDLRSPVEIEWRVIRDSRSEGLGFHDETAPRQGALWLDGDRARVDQSYLLVPGRDGRLHPQNRDREATRHEFQRALLEERLQGDYPVPEWHKVSLLVSSGNPMPSKHWGQLVQYATLAPILATQPRFAFGRDEIEVTSRFARVRDLRLPVLKIQRHATQHEEVWVDPKHDFRIVRWLQTTDDRPSGQVDISYGEDQSARPAGWTVLEFDSQGNVLDFLIAEASEYRIGATIPAATFAVMDTDWNRGSDTSSWNGSFRIALRWMLDTTWFQVLAACLLVASFVLWQRFRERSASTSYGRSR